MSESNQCPECGAALPASAPRGLCPACLLKRGLETNTGGFTAEGDVAPPQPGGPMAGAPGGWTPPGVEELAARFPELEIAKLLGRGGMGAVYQARQKNLDRIVALKILPPEMGQDTAFAERFAREAQAMARLNHPHIVAIYEFGERAGWYYFVMEFVDGMSLRGLLDSGHVAPKEALAIVPQICEALQYAHDQGIVHRDIKPENILLSKQSQVKIADFGLAKLMGRNATSAGMTEKVMGTPHYMAPEQLEHPSEVDHRADIYSLGVVFYQMLTGELPIGRFAPPSQKVIIDVRLDEVVLRALEREPEKRYQQVSQVKTEVETIAMTSMASPSDGSAPVSGSVPKTSLCYVSTPEYLRTFRGRFLFIYQGKGELCLDRQTLNFRSGWQGVTIPLSSISALARGQYPTTAKPLPLHYVAVTFMEHGVPRTLLFTPVRTEMMSPWEANKIAAAWLSALQEAVRARTGRALSVERFELAQEGFWTAMAKTFLLMAAGCTAIGTVLFPLILEHRLPDRLSELLWGLIWGSSTAAGTVALFILIRWWRGRCATVTESNPAGIQPNGSSIVETEMLRQFRARLRPPAIALLIVGLLDWFVVFILAWTAADAYSHTITISHYAAWQRPVYRALLTMPHWLALSFIVSGLLASAAVIQGALALLRPESFGTAQWEGDFQFSKRSRRFQGHGRTPTARWWGSIGACLALVLSPANLLGLPVGLWVLATLKKPDIQQSWQELAARPAGSARRRRYRLRRVVWSVLLGLMLALLCRTFVIQAFLVTGDAVTPELPLGSRVLVYKLAQTFAPGDIVVYRNAEGSARLARVVQTGPVNGKLRVERGERRQELELATSDVVGRVIVNTRSGTKAPLN